jgi:hypothetical protein
MKLSITISFILLCSFLFAGNSAVRKSDQADQKATQSPCCFVREGYQGVCTVTPEEPETCDSILKYLNTAGTAGKTYCGGSKLRGGWKAADCPKDDQSQ